MELLILAKGRNILDYKLIVLPYCLYRCRYLNHLFDWVSLVLQLKESVFEEHWSTQIFLVIFFKLNCFELQKLDYGH